MRVRGEGEGRSGTVVVVSMWWRWRVCVGVHECFVCVLTVDVQACLIGSKRGLLCCDVHGVFPEVNAVHSPRGLSNIPMSEATLVSLPEQRSTKQLRVLGFSNPSTPKSIPREVSCLLSCGSQGVRDDVDSRPVCVHTFVSGNRDAPSHSVT